MRHGVRLVGQRETSSVRARELERGTDDPLDTLVRVDVFLDRDLVARAGFEVAAGPDIHALRVLAKHIDQDVARRDVAQRRMPRIVEADGSQVDIQVEPEAQAEQDVARVLITGHARIAQRAEQDRVMLAQLRHLVRRDRRASAQVALRAEIPFREVEPDVTLRGDVPQHLHRLARDVDADPVTGNHCDACHPVPVTRRGHPHGCCHAHRGSCT